MLVSWRFSWTMIMLVQRMQLFRDVHGPFSMPWMDLPLLPYYGQMLLTCCSITLTIASQPAPQFFGKNDIVLHQCDPNSQSIPFHIQEHLQSHFATLCSRWTMVWYEAGWKNLGHNNPKKFTDYINLQSPLDVTMDVSCTAQHDRQWLDVATDGKNHT
jgi:hypothetical protein